MPFPEVSLAHVKWFEDPSNYPLRTDLVVSDRTAILIGVSLAALLLLYLLQRLVGDPHWPNIRFLSQMAIGAPTLMAVQAAITLIYAATSLTLFAPNLALRLDALGLALAGAQILIAFSFITGVADWVAALALIALGPVAFWLFPPMDVLDQLYWAGIGLFLLVLGRFAVEASRPRSWFRDRGPYWGPRAVASLRVITGVSIMVPALSEKIWNPDIGLAFLANRPPFNFMQNLLGVSWFSNELFVLAAGLTEAVIGVLLVSGLLTRVVILFMWVPFNVSVPFLPPQELLGHLPIFGIMYLLLVHSAGIAPGESLRRETLPGSPIKDAEVERAAELTHR